MNNTILLIEDKTSLSDTLKTLLELHEYNVLLAENGEDGVRQARQSLPQLVISDIYMPVMNGYELLDIFRKDQLLRNIPVLMLTAKTGIDEVNRAMKNGAAGYVTKPFLFRNLHATIRKILL
ncbi:response regulator [Chitinophaga lutea]|uniref:Response regulator n=1 Tax=Chitinophaga lutea TaxID=2488634 RepID=A0A3N4PJN2_9BACT|nr:response regulator [Chitinophaga lutea]RPE08436.1 response regulator [Chitinophaga lutea]